MAYEGYGLRSLAATAIRHPRRLIFGGDMRVAAGEVVGPETVIGYHSSDELLHYLRVEAEEGRILAHLLKGVGDEVQRGEPVAYYLYMLGLGYREYVSPTNGVISSINDQSGFVAIKEHPEPIQAGLAGVVAEVIDGSGVLIETTGAVIDATVGWGDAAWGELCLAVDSPAKVADPAGLGSACRGKVVVAGAHADGKTLHAAYRHGARAVIAGGVDHLAADDFTAFAAQMTQEEYQTRYYAKADDAGDADGQADTGLDRVKMPVLALEGPGRIPIRGPAWRLLSRLAGREVFVDGRDGRSPLGEPPLLIAADPDAADRKAAPPVDGRPAAPDPAGLAAGAPVRVIGGPRSGWTGVVARLDLEVTLETGYRTWAAEVELDDGETIAVPLVNLELLVDFG